MSEKDQDQNRRPRGSKLELKVGAFVSVVLLAGLAVVLLLGSQHHVFESRVRLHAVFDDVGGLRQGAPVWLSGVNVGGVTAIAFTEGGGKQRVRVDMEIAHKTLERVHSDSVARIGAQGLLGDKIIELSLGSPLSLTVAPDAFLPTQAPADFDKLLSQASDILEKGQSVAQDAAATMKAIADPRTLADLRGITASVHHLLKAAEKGDGLVHALFYDQESADDLRALSGELRRLTTHVDQGVQKVDHILAATDKDGQQVLNVVARAAKNIGEVAVQLHDSKMMANLEKASGDVAEMTTSVRSGSGTLGALINDPTVYEQLVTVLGGVQRSRILRALVRYAIRKDDGQGTGRVVDGPSGPKPPEDNRIKNEAATPRIKQ